jgi:hypothetical protein
MWLGPMYDVVADQCYVLSVSPYAFTSLSLVTGKVEVLGDDVER